MLHGLVLEVLAPWLTVGICRLCFDIAKGGQDGGLQAFEITSMLCLQGFLFFVLNRRMITKTRLSHQLPTIARHAVKPPDRFLLRLDSPVPSATWDRFVIWEKSPAAQRALELTCGVAPEIVP